MPLPLLPLLFTGLSIGANMVGANQQGKALASAQAAERLRQRKFDDESFALNANSRERFDTVPENIDTRGSELASMFGELSNEAPVEPIATAPATSSNIVMARENAAFDKAKGQTDQRASALGGLRSFGDLLGTANMGQARDAGQLGLIGSMRRGSQSILPLELEAAAQKGSKWRLLGDLLSAGGGMFGPGGMAGGAFAESAMFNPLFGGRGIGGFV